MEQKEMKIENPCFKRVLSVQDISCVGQCSLTVALPILSACGLETAILPSAVLSTHTAGFKGFTCRDLTPDFEGILDHWAREGLTFDGIYTGYLGSAEQIAFVKRLFKDFKTPDAPAICDPAMADNGKLYPAFDMAYVAEMRKLMAASDIIVPNLTEAALLAGIEYCQKPDDAYIEKLLRALFETFNGTVVLTGVSRREGYTGVLTATKEKQSHYEHEFLPNSCHGTGDIYASAFAGAVYRGIPVEIAARLAADYTVSCIRLTAADPAHWYGARFEPLLGKLAESVNALAQ